MKILYGFKWNYFFVSFGVYHAWNYDYDSHSGSPIR